MLDYSALDLLSVEQMEQDYDNRMGPHGERLLRSDMRLYRAYIDERVNRVNKI